MRSLPLIALAAALAAPASATITYTGHWTVPGDATDLSGLSSDFAQNRLQFGSDLWSAGGTTFWGITDRGPGGGTVSFQPRAQKFTLDIQPDGSVAGFQLRKTVLLTDTDGKPFNGLNPLELNGSKAVLGLSLDPEGLVRLKNGNLLIADEYGPSLYEFDKNGRLLRSFATPGNLIPRDNVGVPNYVDGRAGTPPNRVETGRQDNRGYEGLTVSPDGKYVWAILQDPLMQEGGPGAREGRQSRNLRVVKFDYATGEQVAQYIYQLQPLSEINAGLPPGSQYGPNAQGRNIGVSAIMALPNGKFLVLERDNRGYGVEPVMEGQPPVAMKSVFLVDFAGATDVKAISLAGSNNLPAGVVPATKTLWLDILAELKAAGITVTEKMEGIAFGPAIDGGRSFVVVVDNDFSVTQFTGSSTQFDLCTTATGTPWQTVGLNMPCPDGLSLIPTYSYVFKVSGESLRAAGIPEPGTWAMLIGGFGMVGAAVRRRREARAA